MFRLLNYVICFAQVSFLLHVNRGTILILRVKLDVCVGSMLQAPGYRCDGTYVTIPCSATDSYQDAKGSTSCKVATEGYYTIPVAEIGKTVNRNS